MSAWIEMALDLAFRRFCSTTHPSCLSAFY